MYKITNCIHQNRYSDVETNQPPLVWRTIMWCTYPRFPMVYYYGDQLALNMAPSREYPSSLP